MKVKFKLFANGTSKGAFALSVISDLRLPQSETRDLWDKGHKGIHQIRKSKLQIRNSVSSGGITSLMLDLSRGRFKIKGGGGDLSSLANTPIQIRLEIGDFSEEATFIMLRKRSSKGEKLKY